MNIIILPLYGIGDVLMSTPAVRNLKEQIGARITYLHMFRTTYDILQGNPYIDENIHFPFLEASRLQGIKFLMGFRKKYDASINFYPSNRRDYSLAAFIIGCPMRIGHRYVRRDLRELNFLKNRTYKEDDGLHNVEEDLRLLDFLGIKEKTPYPLEIYLSEEEKTLAGSWFEKRGISGRLAIGFHPGSSVFKAHDRKRWQAGKFAELIRRLAEKDGAFVFLIFGGPEERTLKEEVRTLCGLPESVFTVDTENIRHTAAITERCGLFVANDSGLMHVSAALQVPIVGIFGPTNPTWLGPWKCSHRAVSLGYQCGPCFRYSPIPQKCYEGTDFSCVGDIEVDEVMEAALSLL
jgi:heptosyltransferase-2